MIQFRPDMLERYASDTYRPITFLDRGVTVPFTTPFLLGARIKPHETRNGLEVVISSLSGGRGFYIAPWSALTEICSPTVHDRRLWECLSEHTAITPKLVRDVARSVAAEGLAGREVAAAVASAQADQAGARMRANFLLLLDLIRRTEPAQEAAVPPHTDAPANIERRAKRAVARFAPNLGVSPEVVAGWLEAIADAVVSVGVPGDPSPSRVRELGKRLQALIQDMDAFAANSVDHADQHNARLVMGAAQLTLKCAEAAFRDLDSQLADTMLLLRAWCEDSAPLLRKVTRPDWLLDGWEMILELWRYAEPEMRPGTLSEMALLAPVMPREIKDWLGIEEDWERPYRLRRMVRAKEDWRHGRTIELVARNEALRARLA